MSTYPRKNNFNDPHTASSLWKLILNVNIIKTVINNNSETYLGVFKGLVTEGKTPSFRVGSVSAEVQL